MQARIDAGASPIAVTTDPTLFPASYSYKNRYLWSEMRLGGKVAYVGAFGRWFRRGSGQ
jgi:hypothetical protein